MVSELDVDATPESRLLIKMLNRTGPTVEPWRTPLAAIHQPDVAPSNKSSNFLVPISTVFVVNIKSFEV